ncbi:MULTISPECIES: NTP transferase domain-containing protein [Eikenella]|uniref:NTP transferase domain-containing protein n=1 Tax=Eikenella TaxID=538 RepID=UPI0008A65CA1|nr:MULTISPECIES: NTP transferase domain-containing protein [Eikenella]MDU4300059.1 NTP transferase domain-containing protein [Eikenella corrodens]OFN60693.1 protein licC [Eikenella sp. HMSC061C02]
MNAIILAAGLGSRLKEITKSKHKALIEIKGIPNIERTILYLKEAGIDEIYIVTGYLSSQFEYLTYKYGCKLIKNNKYREYNNIYSFYLASKYLSDSYVIDSDVVLFKNIFLDKPVFSTYYTIIRPESDELEWNPILNEKGIVTDIIISSRHLPSLLGISFWNLGDSKKILAELEKYNKLSVLEDSKLYWDNIPMSLLGSMEIRVRELSICDAYEMDNIMHYKFISNIGEW